MSRIFPCSSCGFQPCNILAPDLFVEISVMHVHISAKNKSLSLQLGGAHATQSKAKSEKDLYTYSTMY